MRQHIVRRLIVSEMSGEWVAGWVAFIRERDRLTQRELALNLGISEEHLSRLKRNGCSRCMALAMTAVAWGLVAGHYPAPPLRYAKKKRLVRLVDHPPGRVSRKGITG
jgi:hypothetical protein